MIAEPTFLNLDLGAPSVRQLLDSVTLENGTIALTAVHGDAEQLGEQFQLGGAFAGVAGIGAAPNGDVYLADTDGNRVLRIAACGGPAESVGCLGSLLSGPRGVLVGPRDALYIADTGNHRVLVIDLATEQIRATWGQADPHGDPVPGADAGEFDGPWDIAADAESRLYVVDHGNRRIQRFNVDGHVDASFAAALATATTVPREPEYIVTVLLEQSERLLVFDRLGPNSSRLLVYDLDAAYLQAATRELRRLLTVYAGGLFRTSPSALAGAGSVLHVAETTTGRVLEFDVGGHFVGFARWHGTVAGLALDVSGRLLIHPGSGSPVRLGAGVPAAAGTFRIGPFAVSAAVDRATIWQKLRARVDPLPAGAHLQLYALSTDDSGLTPPPLGDSEWLAAPVDATTWLTGVDPKPYLWVGGSLTGGSAGGPVVRGLRVEFDREGWLRNLPAVYARESSAFLEPALALLEDALAEQEEHIDALPRLFDPQAAPADALPWLASWLAWELEETLGEAEQRALIGHAFELQARRGTAASLRELVQIVLGADTAITEPASGLRLWQLGDDAALLGWGTMLEAAEPDGAVLGTTSELDRSHLQRDEDFGAPVFDATAHRYCVHVYASDLRAPGARATLERLVEHEQPAGTEAHICVVEPTLRVGFQATLGIDAIVGRESEPLRLSEQGLLGVGAALADVTRPTTVGEVRISRGEISTGRGAT